MLFGVLLHTVTSTLLRIVTEYRVVTLLHNPDLDEPFIIKLLGGELLEQLFQYFLTHIDQAHVCNLLRNISMQVQDKSKGTRAKHAEKV